MILLAPIKTEKAISKIEFDNTMTFQVAMDATKDTVKQEVERLFGVKVASVRTYLTATGKKRALVKVAKGFKAEEITTKLKMA